MPKPTFRGFDPSVLRGLRTRRGWSQERLAAEVGAYPTMVGKWENGQHVPTVATIAALSRVLGTEPAVFTGTPMEHAELLDLRLWSGLSRAQACAATGISARQLRWYEHGTRRPEGVHADRLARLYSVSAEQVAAAWEQTRAQQST